MITPHKFFKQANKAERNYLGLMAQAKKLPADYQFVYAKMNYYLRPNISDSDFDLSIIFFDLLDLFKTGAAQGKHVLEITGRDVGGFCKEYLQYTHTCTVRFRENLNHEILRSLVYRRP